MQRKPSRVSRMSAVRTWIEAIESRLLLSAAPVFFPSSVVGSDFTGTVHLRYHATATARPASAAVALSVSIDSLQANAITGSASVADQASLPFTGTAARRSFAGLFADGAAISGLVSNQGRRIDGSLREVVGGQVVSGSVAVRNLAALAMAHRGVGGVGRGSAAQLRTPGTTLNYYAGAGSTVNAVNAANAGSSLSSNTVNTSTAPQTAVLLPALDTAFTTPNAINPQTTSGGVSAADLTSSPANTNSITVGITGGSTTTSASANGLNSANTSDMSSGLSSSYSSGGAGFTSSYSSSTYTITSIFGT